MIPLWLDCDPGHEDALALLLACALPHFELIGVSTVYGSSSLDSTTNNALSLLTAYHHHHTAVFPGAEKPLEGPIRTSNRVHGRSGLGGTALLPTPLSQRQPDHTAVPAIAEAIEVTSGELIIVATGPLTNLAMLVLRHPNLLDQIRYVSIMGGTLDGDELGRFEYNVWSDPSAANIVLQCPALQGKLILTPLDVSHRVLATPEVLKRIQLGPQLNKYTVFRQMMYELLANYASIHKLEFDFQHGPPIHDPLAVAVLLGLSDQEDLDVEGFNANVKITKGRTIIERAEGEEDEARGGVFITTHLDPAGLWNLVHRSIAILEGS